MPRSFQRRRNEPAVSILVAVLRRDSAEIAPQPVLGETKVSEFSQLVEEATAEIGKLGLKPSADTMFLTSNRAGMHLSCWLPCDPAELDTLTAKLEGEKWKMASD